MAVEASPVIVPSLDLVAELLDVGRAMDAIELALADAGSSARIVPTTLPLLDGAAVRIVAGAARGRAVVRFGAAGRFYPTAHLNTWAAVCDAATGELQGLVRYPFGGLRVAATLGVAARALVTGTTRLAMIGSGNYAQGVVEAIHEAVGISFLSVHSRTHENALAFGERIRRKLGIPVAVETTVAGAVSTAHLVVIGTNSPAPVIDSDVVGSRVLLSYGLETELHPSVYVDAEQVVAADLTLEALVAEQQLATLLAGGALDRGHVANLGAVLRGETRPAPTGLRVFRDSGGGVTDAALAAAVLDEALRHKQPDAT